MLKQTWDELQPGMGAHALAAARLARASPPASQCVLPASAAAAMLAHPSAGAPLRLASQAHCPPLTHSHAHGSERRHAVYRRHADVAAPSRARVTRGARASLGAHFAQRARARAQPRVIFSRTRCAQVTGSLYLVGDFLRLLKPPVRATK
jgi:hypothetical protein